MKTQPRNETQPRRVPPTGWNAQTDDGGKGRKHESFEGIGYGCDRRPMSRAMRMDSKR
ncbi:MAG: hypothetical protein JO006_15040 [Paucibacter sp.]|nr:hypothetical protein [Roseateles sp.]